MDLTTQLSSGYPASVKSAELIFPSKAVYRNRVARIRDAMQTGGFDVLVLQGRANHRFFVGLDGLPDVRPVFLVLLPDTEPVFVSPRIEAPIIRRKCHDEVVAEWGDSEKPWDVLVEHIRRVAPHASMIGVDFDAFTALNLDRLAKSLCQARILDISVIVGDALQANDEATIDLLTACADIAAHKFLSIRKAIAPGVTEWRAALQGYLAATERVAKHLKGDEDHSPLGSSFTVMGSGPIRSANAHSVAAGRIIENRDLVQICCCTPALLGHNIGFDRPRGRNRIRGAAAVRVG